MGTAKPTPALEPLRPMIWVFTPTTRPCRSSNGPPEFPGFMGASVWRTLGTENAPFPLRIVRPTALMIPVVIVNSCPNGFPMAAAICPTFTASLSARGTGWVAAPETSICRTARSESGSLPSDLASIAVRSEKMTVTRSAPSITWWLVTMRPSSSQMKPVPLPRRKNSSGTPGMSRKRSKSKGSSGDPGASGELDSSPILWVTRICTTEGKAVS